MIRPEDHRAVTATERNGELLRTSISPFVVVTLVTFCRRSERIA